MSGRKRTILFSGMIAGDPHQGGATWAILQYLLGLLRLGHDVYFVEPIQPKSLRPEFASLADSTNAAYFRNVAGDFGLSSRSSLLLAGTEQTVGLPYADLLTISRRADLLINVSGMLTDERLLKTIPVRAYLDLDPAFIQIWQAAYGIDMRFAAHTHFVSIGLAIGQPDCPVPDCGKTWIKTLQPIVLQEWPAVGPADTARHEGLTTIANWRGYGSVEYQGVFYGQKVHSFRQLIDLPRRTQVRLMPALAIHPGEHADLALLAENGWELLDPAAVANSPEAYREFVQGSWAEIGVAKSGYVASRCGWISDRSLCYLASGRPVIAHDTGLGAYVPTGEGLLAFSDATSAADAIEQVRRDYARHSFAARRLAEEVFDSNLVLPRLLRELEMG